MTKRAYFGIVLILSGVALIPVSVIFGEQNLTSSQLKAIDTCKGTRDSCNLGCDLKFPVGTARLQNVDCRSNCKETYLTCVFSVRRAPEGPGPGRTGTPPVPPRRPVSDREATAVLPPKTKSPEVNQSQRVLGTQTRKVSPSPTPTPSPKS